MKSFAILLLLIISGCSGISHKEKATTEVQPRFFLFKKKSSNKHQSLLKEIKSFSFNGYQDGKFIEFNLDVKSLNKNNQISFDGILLRMSVGFNKVIPATIFINGKKIVANNYTTNPTMYFVNVGSIDNCYPILGNSDCNEIEIKSGNKKFKFYFQHHGEQIIFENKYALSYIGRMNHFNIEKDKIQEISNGMNNVFQRFKISLIPKVVVVEQRRKNVTLLPESFTMVIPLSHWNWMTKDYLRNTVEHESIHVYDIKKGISQSREIKQIFSKLLGFESYNEKHLAQLKFAESFVGHDCRKDHVFFSFINENSFFRIGGGHSYDNTYEFVTSFIHTLFEIDNIDEKLNQPVYIKTRIKEGADWKTYENYKKLNKLEKKEILSIYKKILEAIIKALKAKKSTSSEIEFFKKALLKIK